jgi:hypothetical protein
VRDVNRLAYQRELVAAAKRLRLRAQGDIEKSIINHAIASVRGWIAAHGQPTNLSDLLEKIAVSFSIEIIEIHDDDDLEALFQRIPPKREAALARLAAELDDATDAVIMQRQNRQPWEMPYLAVINCRGWHHSRRYFSKWHEVIHLLLDGRQLRFAFRRRASKRKHPEEVLVDKIAGVLAFHPDLFEPLLLRELKTGRLTFDVVERVRSEVAPDASRESTLYACLRSCPETVCFLKAQLGYKLAERRQLDDLLSGLPDSSVPQPNCVYRRHHQAQLPCAPEFVFMKTCRFRRAAWCRLRLLREARRFKAMNPSPFGRHPTMGRSAAVRFTSRPSVDGRKSGPCFISFPEHAAGGRGIPAKERIASSAKPEHCCACQAWITLDQCYQIR